jgi:hypothetical protein
MTKTKESEPQQQKDLAEAMATDEHAGKGGSYVFDPATGKRTPTQPLPTEKE